MACPSPSRPPFPSSLLALAILLAQTLLASGVAATSPKPAPAPPKPATATATAAEHFREGRRLYLRKDYAAALEHFRQAHRQDPRDFLLFNIAVCLERLERDAEALAHYRRYLRRQPAEAAALEPRLRDLERRLEPGRVRIAGGLPGSDVFADGHFAGQLPLRNPIWATPGRETTVRVLRPGFHPYETRLRVPAGAEVVVTISQVPQADPDVGTRPVVTILSAPTPRDGRTFADLRAEPVPARRSQLPTTLGVAGTILVTAGLCVGAWAWWKAGQAQTPTSWDWERREALSEDARHAAWGADALLFSGAALLTAFVLVR
jgi:tetratricopeptide (TPR) repeat protein